MVTWVVGYDFSTCADAALERAATMMARRNGQIVVANILEEPDPAIARELRRASPALADLSDVRDAIADAALARLKETIKLVKARHPGVTFNPKVEFGHGAEGLTRLADELDADMIVVGTHGRRGITKFFLGSVADRVLRWTSRPVLVVKEAAEDAR